MILSQHLYSTKEGLHKESFLVKFTNFLMIALQQKSSERLLQKFVKYVNIVVCTFFFQKEN